MPGIFANRRTNPQVADPIRPRDIRRLIEAFFVEHIIIWQNVLFDYSLDPAASKNIIGIIKTGLIAKRPTDPHGRPLITRLGQALNLRHRIAGKRGFKHQILHLIAGDKHLGQHNHISARAFGEFPSLKRLRRIASKITHCCVELRHG